MPLCSMLVSCAFAEVAPRLPAAKAAEAPTMRLRARLELFIRRVVGRKGLTFNSILASNLRVDYEHSEVGLDIAGDE